MDSKHKPVPAMTAGRPRSDSEDKRNKMQEQLTAGGVRTVSSGSEKDSSKTHVLLINGGGHEAFFGDFFGLMRYYQSLKGLNIGGEFWATEGSDGPSYFAKPDNGNRTDIKFCGTSVLSKHVAEHQSRDYEIVPKEQVVSRFYQWLHQKADTESPSCAKDGDSIHIILLAHGYYNESEISRGGIVLGTNIIYPNEFVEAINEIPRNVQINCITNACYSAMFADKVRVDGAANRYVQVASQPGQEAFPAARSVSARFQNSAFIGEWVKSLANLGPRNPITLSKLQDNLKKATLSHPDKNWRSEPYAHQTAPLTTNVSSLLIRDFADFPMMQENSAIRRRVELSTDYLRRPFPSSANVSTTGFQMAVAAIQAERDIWLNKDGGSFGEGYFESSQFTNQGITGHAPELVRGYLIRGRLQAAVLQAFLGLCLNGRCSVFALERFVSYGDATSTYGGKDRLSIVTDMLMCFEAFRCNWAVEQAKWNISGVEWVRYGTPRVWLAIMITRSAPNLTKVFETLRIQGYLGHVVEASLAKLPKWDEFWTPFAEQSAGSEASGAYAVGTWLPNGISVGDGNFDCVCQTVTKNFYSRLVPFEEAHKEMVGLTEEDCGRFEGECDIDIRDWRYENAFGPPV